MRKAISLLLALTMAFTVSAWARDYIEGAVPCMYDEVSSFSEGLAAVELEHHKWGYIDRSGKVVITCGKDYGWASGFSDGLAAVLLKDQYGYINKSGTEIIPCRYNLAGDFSEGLAPVCLGDFPYGKFGYIDKTGKEVIHFQYNDADTFSEGLARVWLTDNKSGYIDKTGTEVIPCRYDDAGRFSEGLAPVKENGKWKFIDKLGGEILVTSYDEVHEFSDGLALVQRDNMWGYIDKSGTEVIPCKYSEAKDFSEGLAAVKINGRWGFIDRLGTETVPCVYSSVRDFSEGMAAVMEDYAIGKWGFITIKAKPVVQPTSQNLTVNGEKKNTEIYNIDGNNFFKLRDMAMLLNGTSSQFSVDFDAASGTIAVKTGAAYTSVGGELTTGTDKSASAVLSEQKVTINGSAVELTAWNIGGNNFFKLRDLGEALNFNVDWDGDTATMLVTSR